jgi:hypothetical protein
MIRLAGDYMRGKLGPALVTGTLVALILSAPGTVASAATLKSPWRLVSRSAKPVGGRPAELLAVGRKDAWDITAAHDGGALVLHWTGGRWRAVHLPGAASFTPIDAAASSADDVWVGGYRSADTAEGVIVTNEILRYNGRAWLNVAAPEPNFGFGLAVVSSSNAWGLSGTGGCAATCYTGLLHWNGQAWQPARVPLAVASLAATPTGQVWVIGQPRLSSSNVPAGPVEAFTWTGGTWRYVRGIPDRAGLCDCGFDVAARNNVWIDNAHWNGKSWRLLRIPRGTFTEGPVVEDGHGGVWFGAWTHWTGRTWITYLLPAMRGGYSEPFLTTMARLPGTTTILAGGNVTRGAGTYNIIMRAGKLP